MPKKVVIYESVKHFIPTGFGWMEGFDGLGHEVYLLPDDPYSINEIDGVVDILVITGMHEAMVSEIIQFRNEHPNTKIVCMCFMFQEYYLKLADTVNLWVELVCQHDLTKKKFADHGLPLLFVPLAASKKLFYKIPSNPVYDVSFIGQFGNTGHGYRNQDSFLFPFLKEHEYKGFFAGFNYQGKLYNPIKHIELNDVYNKTAVNLNFHYDFQKQQSDFDELYRLDFNGRVFEIAMSGNFQLCDHPLIQEYFGESIGFATKNEWKEMVDYYLNNFKSRTEKAAAAREICLNHHTWEHRIQLVLDTLYGRN